MEKNYKHLLKERLTVYLDCKSNWQDYFKNQEINEKAKKQLYKKKKLLNFFINIYFLPINFLKYCEKKKDRHVYDKIVTTIDIIKDELETNIDKNQKGRKND
tara:strand:- start:6972 stop:7277 length:306 start_codon:yes stop_codon:yes gene_type:complete